MSSLQVVVLLFNWLISLLSSSSISGNWDIVDRTIIEINSIYICDPSWGDPEIFIRTSVDGVDWDTTTIEATENYETLSWTGQTWTYYYEVTSVTFSVYDEDTWGDELRGNEQFYLPTLFSTDAQSGWDSLNPKSSSFYEGIYHGDDSCYEYLTFTISFYGEDTPSPTPNPTDRPTDNPTQRPTPLPTLRPTPMPSEYPTYYPTLSPTIDWSVFIELENYTCSDYTNFNGHFTDISYEDCMTECYNLATFGSGSINNNNNTDDCKLVSYWYYDKSVSDSQCYIFSDDIDTCLMENFNDAGADFGQIETYLVSNDDIQCDDYPSGL